MPQTSLKLVEPDNSDPDVLRLERRRSYRHGTSGQVTAVQKPADPGEYNAKICSLELKNISGSGMGAMSPEPITKGTRVSVFFPPHGAEVGFDRSGWVVRCVRRENAHEIGVRFNERNAA